MIEDTEFRFVDPTRRELLRRSPRDEKEAARLVAEVVRLERSPSVFARLAAVRIRAKLGDVAGALATIRRLEAEHPDDERIRGNREYLERTAADAGSSPGSPPAR